MIRRPARIAPPALALGAAALACPRDRLAEDAAEPSAEAPGARTPADGVR